MARWPLDDFNFSADGQIDAVDRSIIATWGFNILAALPVSIMEVLRVQFRSKIIGLKQAGPITLRYRSKPLGVK